MHGTLSVSVSLTSKFIQPSTDEYYLRSNSSLYLWPASSFNLAAPLSCRSVKIIIRVKTFKLIQHCRQRTAANASLIYYFHALSASFRLSQILCSSGTSLMIETKPSHLSPSNSAQTRKVRSKSCQVRQVHDSWVRKSSDTHVTKPSSVSLVLAFVCLASSFILNFSFAIIKPQSGLNYGLVMIYIGVRLLIRSRVNSSEMYRHCLFESKEFLLCPERRFRDRLLEGSVPCPALRDASR